MALRSKEVSGDLAQGDIDVLFDFGSACELVTVYIHFDTPVTEEVKISYKSAAGAAFDTLIDAKTLQGAQDYVYAAAGEVAFNEGDQVRVQITNANTVGVAGISVKARNKA
jgi:hypothetical protein